MTIDPAYLCALCGAVWSVNKVRNQWPGHAVASWYYREDGRRICWHCFWVAVHQEVTEKEKP